MRRFAIFVSSAAFVAMSAFPGAAQDDQTDALTTDRLSTAVETLEELNAAASAVRGRGADRDSAKDPAVEALAEEAVEFLGNYARDKVIYGHDDRKNYYEAGPNQQRAANATAVFVDAYALSDGPGGKLSVPDGNPGFCSPSDQAAHSLPYHERFYDEPAPGFCSGFKVGPDLVATAGHCIEDELKCASTRIVFGFHVTQAGVMPNDQIAPENVYRCTQVLTGELDHAGADWRVIRVDRPIQAPQVTLRDADAGPPEIGTELTVIGYPVGLPVKIAGGSKIRKWATSHFVADLDTYGGNSGSPVFNSEALSRGELLAEGILVRGDDDFETYDPCLLSKRCPIFSLCRGEDVTSAARISSGLRSLR